MIRPPATRSPEAGFHTGSGAVHDMLERFTNLYPQGIGMGLDRMRRILADLGNPHLSIPPAIHVAGTNGKGSCIAFLRAILQAASLRPHVMTSPHLVRFNERLVIAGDVIDDDALLHILQATEKGNANKDATFFELITAAGFLAFAQTPADITLLETGMGGRLDGTNVIERPLATIITSISFDHMQHLGHDLCSIAAEKAGIMKAGVPCIIGPQPDTPERRAILALFKNKAAEIGCPLYCWSQDWNYVLNEDGFTITDSFGSIDLPPPALLGKHQYGNAATAIVALRLLKRHIPDNAYGLGLQQVQWPARLQPLDQAPFTSLLPDIASGHAELWLDGGHNDHGGAILAEQARLWAVDGRPLIMIAGMINTKDPSGFLKPLLPHIYQLVTVPVIGHHLSLSPDLLAEKARILSPDCPIIPAHSIEQALQLVAGVCNQQAAQPYRILIAGSLYLAGHVLSLMNEKI